MECQCKLDNFSFSFRSFDMLSLDDRLFCINDQYFICDKNFIIFYSLADVLVLTSQTSQSAPRVSDCTFCHALEYFRITGKIQFKFLPKILVADSVSNRIRSTVCKENDVGECNHVPKF